jgi:hypothetical protein
MVFRCCVLYSVFAPGERLYERGQHVEISGNRNRTKMTSGHFQAHRAAPSTATKSTNPRRKRVL